MGPAARDWIALVVAVAVAVAVVEVARRLVTRRLARRWPTVAAEIRPVLRPAFLTGVLVAVRATFADAMMPVSVADWARHVLSITLIGSFTWLAVEVLYAASDIYLTHLSGVSAAGHGRQAQRTRTQDTVVRRSAGTVIAVIGVGAALFTFPAMRSLGAGVLASAGVIGIVVGIAAQSTLANLFAGLQLAFSDALRMGDIVVVEGQYGTIDELTLSYVAVRTWDERRLVMPVSYFTQTPFESWTKSDAELLGTVYLRVDWSVPVADVREAVGDWLAGNRDWDRRAWSVVVTDVLDNGLVEVRAMVSAADADTLWALRCGLREFLIGYLRENHPGALPRLRAQVAPDDHDPVRALARLDHR